MINQQLKDLTLNLRVGAADPETVPGRRRWLALTRYLGSIDKVLSMGVTNRRGFSEAGLGCKGAL